MAEKISCPYCGAEVALRDSPIVATNVDGEREDYETGELSLASGEQIITWVGEWPVVYLPPTDNGRGGLLRRSRLPDPTQVAAAVDLPAYACRGCQSPLPEDAGKRPLLTIAVVGATTAGKSSYLASLIYEGERRQRLRPHGWSEFILDEASQSRYQQHYFRRVFHEGTRLPSTPKPLNGRERFQPLACRVTIGEHEIVLLLHDVGGMVWEDRRERAQFAPFLSHADAVVFMVDPVQLDGMDVRGEHVFGSVHQPNLLDACVRQIDETRLPNVPFALVLSKSDLVRDAHPRREFAFSREPVADHVQWQRDLMDIDQEVKELLADAHADDLLAAADRIPLHQFFAVSALGGDLDTPGTKPQPLRCLDPLVWTAANL